MYYIFSFQVPVGPIAINLGDDMAQFKIWNEQINLNLYQRWENLTQVTVF
jgi:hypothetical protein